MWSIDRQSRRRCLQAIRCLEWMMRAVSCAAAPCLRTSRLRRRPFWAVGMWYMWSDTANLRVVRGRRRYTIDLMQRCSVDGLSLVTRHLPQRRSHCAMSQHLASEVDSSDPLLAPTTSEVRSTEKGPWADSGFLIPLHRESRDWQRTP
jgi:hypothetical protein